MKIYINKIKSDFKLALMAFLGGLVVFMALGASNTNFIATASPAWVTNYVNSILTGGTTNGVFQYTAPLRFKYRAFTNDIALGSGDMWLKDASADETYTFSGAPTNEYVQVVTVRIKNTASTNITPTFTGAQFISGNDTIVSNGYFGEFTFMVWGDTNIHAVAQKNFSP